MRYITLLLLVATMSISIQSAAQTYYEVDLSTAFHDDGNLPNGFNYLVHYDSQEKDFLVANASNTALGLINSMWVKANVPNNFANQTYVSMEVCYDVFPYKENRLSTPPFGIPAKKEGPLTKGIDTKMIQARLAKPLPGSKPGSGLFEVIDDMSPRNVVTEGYQCHNLEFPVPVTLPRGSQISTRMIIGAKEVFRLDRIRLYRTK